MHFDIHSPMSIWRGRHKHPAKPITHQRHALTYTKVKLYKGFTGYT